MTLYSQGPASASATESGTSPRSEQIRGVAGCVVTRDRRHAADLARVRPGGSEEQAAWAELAPTLRRCLLPTIPTEGEGRPLLAGAIAERLYLQTVTSYESHPTRGRDAQTPALIAQATANRTLAWPVESAAAECLVSVAPNQSDLWLRRAASLSDPRLSFDGLGQFLSVCLPRGSSLTIQPSRLYAELARALYRLMNVTMQPLLPGTARPR